MGERAEGMTDEELFAFMDQVDEEPPPITPAAFATREARAFYAKEHGSIPSEVLAMRQRARLVSSVLLPLLERLSQEKAGGHVTEKSLRLMAWVETGHAYGERSISRMLRKGLTVVEFNGFEVSLRHEQTPRLGRPRKTD